MENRGWGARKPLQTNWNASDAETSQLVCFGVKVEDAAKVVRELNIDVMTAGVCLPCLTFVAFPLDSGDAPRARREARKLAPILWEEGLELAVMLALENAKRGEVAGANAAIEDVRVHGSRSLVVEAVVWRLAEQLVEDMRRSTCGDIEVIT